MKKIIGTLLLVVGLIITVVSSIAATEIDCEKRKLWNKAMEEFDSATKFRLDSEQQLALFALLFGIIMFIVGLILVLTKTKKQKELETEILSLKHLKEKGLQSGTVNELEQLYELKQKGILTEEEFSNKKKKILE